MLDDLRKMEAKKYIERNKKDIPWFSLGNYCYIEWKKDIYEIINISFEYRNYLVRNMSNSSDMFIVEMWKANHFKYLPYSDIEWNRIKTWDIVNIFPEIDSTDNTYNFYVYRDNWKFLINAYNTPYERDISIIHKRVKIVWNIFNMNM